MKVIIKRNLIKPLSIIVVASNSKNAPLFFIVINYLFFNILYKKTKLLKQERL
jgi:hypothetical protein